MGYARAEYSPPPPEKLSPEDIADELEDQPQVLSLLKRLPKELWARHYQVLKSDFVPGESDQKRANRQVEYLTGILEGRKEAIRAFSFSDSAMELRVAEEADGIDGFGRRLQEVLESPENLLGFGTTARVKSMRVRGFDKSIAVKFLLTPNQKTLTVNAEYDMLREVETMTKIEVAEQRHGAGTYIRVPHGYFFYKYGKLQCYGMSEVTGVRLETFLGKDNVQDPRILEKRDRALQAVRQRFSSEDSREALLKEADAFVKAMHEVCLHGDIKPKNVMVDEDGTLYLIDFGQSVSVMNVDGRAVDQLSELQDSELRDMRACVQQLLRYVPQSK